MCNRRATGGKRGENTFLDKISMETRILGQLWVKASEEVVALLKSNDRPGV